MIERVAARVVVAACAVGAIVLLVLSALPLAGAVEADAVGGPRSAGLAQLATLFWIGSGEIVDQTLAWIARGMIVAGVALLIVGAIVQVRARRNR